MGDDDDGAAVRAGELAQQLHHRQRGLGVERGGRLVADEDRRVAAERARDRDALLLAARQIGGQVVHARAEPDELEQPARPRRAGPSRRGSFIWIAIATFSSAVSAGNRLKPWNTKPKLRARSARQLALGRARRRCCPRARPRRLVGVSRRPRIEISVVLPEPDGPSISVTSPARMSSVASESAATACLAGAVGLADADEARERACTAAVPGNVSESASARSWWLLALEDRGGVEAEDLDDREQRGERAHRDR